MALRRRAAGVALVVLAAFVLVVISASPRGMLRAVAVDGLEERPVTPSGVVLSASPEHADIRLPSVRVSVARDDEEASGDAQTERAASGGIDLVDVVIDLEAAVIDEPAASPQPAPVRPWGSRAPPPLSI